MPTPTEASDQVDRILEMIEEIDDETKNKALDFFEGVSEKSKAILSTIEDTLVVTKNQQRALDNMEDKVRNWYDRNRDRE